MPTADDSMFDHVSNVFTSVSVWLKQSVATGLRNKTVHVLAMRSSSVYKDGGRGNNQRKQASSGVRTSLTCGRLARGIEHSIYIYCTLAQRNDEILRIGCWGVSMRAGVVLSGPVYPLAGH